MVGLEQILAVLPNLGSSVQATRLGGDQGWWHREPLEPFQLIKGHPEPPGPKEDQPFTAGSFSGCLLRIKYTLLIVYPQTRAS